MDRHNSAYRRAWWAAIAAMLSCAHGAPPRAPAPAIRVPACLAHTLAAGLPDSLVVAVSDAPEDSDAAVRLDASPVYGSLLRLSCTAPYRATAEGPTTIRLTASGGQAPVLVVHRIGVASSRDALDAGVDVLVTRDPAAIAYAARQPDVASIPLPWDRAYVLAVPGDVAGGTVLAPDPPGGAGLTPASAGLRAALAADAVRAEAAPYEPPYWWAGLRACDSTAWLARPGPRPGPRRGGPLPSRHIVYVAGDDVARSLAARVVALAAATDRVSTTAMSPAIATLGVDLRATALPAADFARALAAGGEAAYVLALPLAPSSPCRAGHALGTMAPWALGVGDLDPAADPGTGAPRLEPLVVTRPRALVRRGAMSRAIDWAAALSSDSASGPLP
jgi:hypothetical protein